MKKKLTALLLALAMLLSLVACSNSNSNSNNSSNNSNNSTSSDNNTSSPPAGDNTPIPETPTNVPSRVKPDKPAAPVTINVATYQTGDGMTVLQETAEAFNKEWDGWFIANVYYAGSAGELDTLIQTSTDNDRPDIFTSSGNNSANYINAADEEKIYIPINEFIQSENFDTSDILNHLTTIYQRNGEWHCFPFGNTNVGQFMNTQVLSALNIDVTTIDSYQDLLAVCDQVAQAGYKNFYYMRRLTHIDWLNYALTAQGIQWYDMNNGLDGTPTKPLYTEGECYTATLAFFQVIRDMLDRGYAYDTTVSANDGLTAFSMGTDVLFADGYASGINNFRTTVAQNGQFEFVYRVSPVVETGKPSRGQSPGGSALFISKTGDEVREWGSWEFAKWMLRPEVTSAYAIATGYVPITQSGCETPEFQAYIQEFPSSGDVVAAQAATEPGVCYALTPVSSDANIAYKEICQKLINDPTYTAEMAVQELDSRVAEALELYRITEGIS